MIRVLRSRAKKSSYRPCASAIIPTAGVWKRSGTETQPPARYTEASLVKTLESEGIGRPSTYASIISTIIAKGYAQLVGNALIPTFTAFAVTDLLEKHFPEIVDPSFTSRMEQTLDDIATGEVQWLPYLREFYSGEEGLEKQVKDRESQIDPKEARTIHFGDLDAKIRISKTGAYIESENGNINLPKDMPPADLNAEQVEVLLLGPKKLGVHPENGEPIYVKLGPYGHYVQLGDKSDANPKPKSMSLSKGMTPENVTIEQAVDLLALPRTLGLHPDTGRKVQASLGRFGPYIVHDLGKGEDGKVHKDYRSLKAADNVHTVSFERAVQLLSEPKAERGKRGTAKPLRELGAHPEEGEPVNIYEGPYGPYIKYGKVNASLPEGQTVESITMEIALGAIAVKAGTTKGRKTTGKTTGRSKKATDDSAPETTAKKTTTKKASTTKKATTPKSTAKKTTTKTAAAKKTTSTRKKVQTAEE